MQIVIQKNIFIFSPVVENSLIRNTMLSGSVESYLSRTSYHCFSRQYSIKIRKNILIDKFQFNSVYIFKYQMMFSLNIM